MKTVMKKKERITKGIEENAITQPKKNDRKKTPVAPLFKSTKKSYTSMRT